MHNINRLITPEILEYCVDIPNNFNKIDHRVMQKIKILFNLTNMATENKIKKKIKLQKKINGF